MRIIDSKEFNDQIKSIKKKHPNTRISIRKSGTEPKIRVMAESDSENDISTVINNVQALIT